MTLLRSGVNIKRKLPAHPENFCQSCGNQNPSWFAPNKLWNLVTENPPGLIICPICFADMALDKGIVVEMMVSKMGGKL